MKKNRTAKILILLAVLAVAIVAVVVAKKYSEKVAAQETTESTETESYVLYEADGDGVTAFSYVYSTNAEVGLKLEDDTWHYTEDEAFPVIQSTVKNMANMLSEVVSEKMVVASGAGNFGLNDPELTITVGDTTITFGSETSIGGDYYVSNGDGKIYLLSEDYMTGFSYALRDLLQYETIPDLTKATMITVVKGDRTTELDTSDEFYDSEVLSTILTTLTDAEWYACCSYNATDEELEAAGLKEPAMTISVDYPGKDGSSKNFTIHLGNIESSLYRYARIDGSSMYYLVDATIYDYFDYTKDDWAEIRETESEDGD